jgi:hypothetical protein
MHLPEVLVAGVILVTTSYIEIAVGVILAKGEETLGNLTQHFYGCKQIENRKTQFKHNGILLVGR